MDDICQNVLYDSTQSKTGITASFSVNLTCLKWSITAIALRKYGIDMRYCWCLAILPCLEETRWVVKQLLGCWNDLYSLNILNISRVWWNTNNLPERIRDDSFPGDASVKILSINAHLTCVLSISHISVTYTNFQRAKGTCWPLFKALLCRCACVWAFVTCCGIHEGCHRYVHHY